MIKSSLCLSRSPSLSLPSPLSPCQDRLMRIGCSTLLYVLSLQIGNCSLMNSCILNREELNGTGISLSVYEYGNKCAKMCEFLHDCKKDMRGRGRRGRGRGSVGRPALSECRTQFRGRLSHQNLRNSVVFCCQPHRVNHVAAVVVVVVVQHWTGYDAFLLLRGRISILETYSMIP